MRTWSLDNLTYELTEPEVRFFRSAGYVRGRGRLDPDRVSRLRGLVGQQFEHRIAPYRVNETGTICRIDQVIDRDPLFMDTLCLPPVLDPLLSLLGPNIELLRFRHNHATRNLQGDIPCRLHRDILQWTRGIVTAFIYLEDTGVENGCTHIVPGSQYLPFAGMPPDGGGGNWADDHDEYRFAGGAGIGLAHAIGSYDAAQLPRLAGAALAQLPAVWVLGAVVVALFGLVFRAVTAAWAALGACALLWFIGPLVDAPGWLLGVSPFDHVPAVPASSLAAGPLLALTAVAIALTCAGLAGFRRRDIG